MTVAVLSEAFQKCTLIKGAALLVHARDTGRFLAVHRRKKILWGLPGGRVEPGESFAAAAVREFRQATDYGDQPLQDVTRVLVEWGQKETAANTWFLSQTFLAQVDREFKVPPNKELSEARWLKSLRSWPRDSMISVQHMAQNARCMGIIAEKTGIKPPAGLYFKQA